MRRQFASEEEIRAYYNRQENFLGEDMKHQIRHPYGVWNCMPVRTATSSHSLTGPSPVKQSRFVGPVSSVSGSSAASLHSSPTVTMVTGQHSSSQVSPAQPAKVGSSSSSTAGKTVTAETSPSVPYVYQKDDLKLVINLRSTVAPLTPTETTSTTSSATNTPTTTTTTASSAASTSASVSAQTVAEDIPAKQGKMKKACKDMTAQEIMDSVKGTGEFTSLSLSLSLPLSLVSVQAYAKFIFLNFDFMPLLTPEFLVSRNH